jgi:hypothetical protein
VSGCTDPGETDDGYYRPLTFSDVESFQTAYHGSPYHLSVDGITGPATWERCVLRMRPTDSRALTGMTQGVPRGIRPSAEFGSHGAQPVLQEALFDFAGRQGHRGVKFPSRLICVAKPTQVVRQGGVPQM